MADKHFTLSDYNNNTNEKLINEASVLTETGKKYQRTGQIFRIIQLKTLTNGLSQIYSMTCSSFCLSSASTLHNNRSLNDITSQAMFHGRCFTQQCLQKYSKYEKQHLHFKTLKYLLKYQLK